MARYEGRLTPGAEITPDASDLLAALQARAGSSLSARQEAIACYLSGGEGWREALGLLGGAFASRPAGLRPEKER